MKNSNNELYCNLCSYTVFGNGCFLVENHRHMFKHQKALDRAFEVPIPYTSQTFLRSSNTDFVKKVAKRFFSADMPLYKLKNKHIKNLFPDFDHSLTSEATCRKTVLQLSVNKLQQIRNDVDNKQIYWLLMRTLYLAYNILNILVRNLEAPYVSYLYDCQTLPCAPNNNCIAPAVDNAVGSFKINKNSFCLLIVCDCKYNTKICGS